MGLVTSCRMPSEATVSHKAATPAAAIDHHSTCASQKWLPRHVATLLCVPYHIWECARPRCEVYPATFLPDGMCPTTVATVVTTVTITTILPKGYYY